MSKDNQLTGYDMSRAWFNWAFENPEKISPNHAAIFFFAIEHCNRLGWKEKFGFPSQMVMDAIGIKKNHTYIKYFTDLCEWGFFKLIQKSTNQYSANIISLQCAKPKNGKALDKATIRHTAKQPEGNGQGIGPIDKPLTNKPINQEPDFSFFGVNNGFQISVKKVYAGDKAKIIYDLREYFTKEQIYGFEKSGWIKFDDFMKENPGRVFDDDDHVYNSFRNFHTNGNGKTVSTKSKFVQ